MLEIVNIRKSFEGQRILHGVDLKIETGEFFSLLGPSGCGKTTLLRILAGLEQADEGELRLDGQPVHELPPQRRPFNMVFQRYALFPHLTVEENVAFGLRLRGVRAAELSEKTRKALDLVGLAAWATRKPETLSGGQAQRVAVARALVNEPRILLLDEPLSALDQKLREHLQTELRELQKRLSLCFIAVTHDQEEAFAMSDRIGVMNQGRLEQVGTSREIYAHPRSAFVAQFMGRTVAFDGIVQSSQSGWVRVALGSGEVVRARGETLAVGSKARVFVRTENLFCGSPPEGIENNLMEGRIEGRVFKGPVTELLVRATAGPRLAIARTEGSSSFSDGERVRVCFAADQAWAFPESAG